MGKMVGYMVTWTAYGTWLQGDKRGYVMKGEVRKENQKLREMNDTNLLGKTVKLTKAERKIIEEAIVKEAAKWGQQIHAISASSKHVHIVLGYNGRDIGRSVRRYKNAAYFTLRRNGHVGRLWTKGYDKRYCFEEKSLRARIAYVEKHNLT